MDHPPKELYKMNIQIQGPIWSDWCWSFDKPIQMYDYKKLYMLLHKKAPLIPTLNMIMGIFVPWE
jgi:hypothetical protein